MIAQKLFRRPVVLHIHGAEYISSLNESGLLRLCARLSLHHADLVLALTESWRIKLLEAFPRSRIEVLGNGVRDPWSELDSPKVREGGRLRCIAVGRLGYRKGTYDLLTAWESGGLGEIADLELFGDGEVEESRLAVQSVGLTSVHIRGWQDAAAVQDGLASSDVLLLPSYAEGQPMAIIEAMGNGLAIVASNVGGIPEMVGAGAGLLVEAGAPEQIVLAVRMLHANRDLLRESQLTARRCFLSGYSVDRKAGELAGLYATLGAFHA